MDCKKKALKSIGVGLTLLIGLVFSIGASANTEIAQLNQTQKISSDGKYEVQFVRDKNYACTQCHKDDHDALKGAHATAINEKTGRNVGCIDCHSNIGPHHRDRADKVIKFHRGQVAASLVMPVDDAKNISKQNAQCVDCHAPAELRKADWTHDVHALKLSCASCHKVHPTTDPIKNIESKQRIQMCVDCHSAFEANHKRGD
ncbi:MULTISPECIES: cytochrome c nitrite reductase pentaheme subunit [Vibrio]|uniref:Cytochrome c nitrite reductase pentaheme subunit n=1 Tax=Vibrio algicola TaxID=2662262 RepID=A0A5Q0TJ89_9VIBR|nr:MULTISPECIES: cytochrome c nitrite reductase pentaheme subunit [Vibrio]MBD1575676.1 cytochrome c nitrite reductase pentaheme subunit [Vibrio sp. S11_S32]